MKGKRSRRAVSAAIILSLMLSVFSGCGYTTEELYKMWKYEQTGRSNAVSYIQEKYGFKPSVVSVECETYDPSPVIDFSPSPTGDVYVQLRDRETDVTFWVYTDGEETGTGSCLDNYQYLQIEEAVLTELEAALGLTPVYIELAYGDSSESGRQPLSSDSVDKEYGLVQEVFDGTNLAQVLGSGRNNQMAVGIVSDRLIPELADLPVGEPAENGVFAGSLSYEHELLRRFGKNLDCFLVNYRDEEAALSENLPTAATYELGYGIEKSLLFLRDYYAIDFQRGAEESRTEYFRCEIKQIDGFFYIPAGGICCEIVPADEEMEPESNWNGRGFIDAQKVFGTYRANSDADRVYLFIPVDVLQADDLTGEMLEKGDVDIATQISVDGENGKEFQFGTGVTWIVNGMETYLTTTIYSRDIQRDLLFTVMADRG